MKTFAATTARLLVQLLFAIALPISLIFANVWYITNSEWLYSYNWWRNGIPARTGIPIDGASGLDSAATQIKDYFNNDISVLVVSADVYGVFSPSIYNQRETVHMADVKELIGGVRDIALWMGVASTLILLVGALLLRGLFARVFMRTLILSAVITFAFIAAVLVAASINFNWIFTQFHVLSFANNFWLLDPNDYLIRMFPARFFFESTLFIGGLTVLNYAVLFIVALLSIRLLNRSSE